MAITPSPGEITSPYGWRVHPVYGTRRHHDGTDFGWGNGWNIRAPESGRIVAYHENGIEGYGKRLDLIGDSGAVHYMGHTAKAYATSGRVKQGQDIAVIGNTGVSADPHLHWEVKVKGKIVDPMKWLRSQNKPKPNPPTPITKDEEMSHVVSRKTKIQYAIFGVGASSATTSLEKKIYNKTYGKPVTLESSSVQFLLNQSKDRAKKNNEALLDAIDKMIADES